MIAVSVRPLQTEQGVQLSDVQEMDFHLPRRRTPITFHTGVVQVREFAGIRERQGERMCEEATVTLDSVVSTGKDLVFSNLADEIVILDLKSGVYHGLESVGARIWELIKEPMPLAQVRDALLDEYEVEPQRCEKDLLELIGELKGHGLVEVRCQTRG
jgi:hypothetical protein